MKDSNSRELYGRALSVMPGGVNSSVRATTPYPAFINRGTGGSVIDVDGNRYIDFIMGYGPLLFGHDLPDSVQSRVQSILAEGPMYGAPTEVEVELAEFIVRHVPTVEMIRFVNSGTEATVSAIRLARAVTGRNKIVVMDGGYHGANDSTLVEGSMTETAPSTPGIPLDTADHVISIPFNDQEAVHEVFASHGTEIAAVITEPILGNTGIITPQDGFHETLRDLCTDNEALLIFDEVITGFRVGGFKCAQGKFGIEPDITTFGKIIGGGMPVGAIGGRADLIESFTPSGNVFQSGTFSGHPVTMAAGVESLKYAADNDVYDHVNGLGERLRDGLRDIIEDQAPSYTVVGTDSMFKVLFTRKSGRIQNASDVRGSQKERWERLFRTELKNRGILLPANQFESQFVCYAHSTDDIDRALDAYAEAI